MLAALRISSSGSPEYLYPVGSVFFEDEEKVCVLYQRATTLELLLWDSKTHTVMRGLSHFMPAGLTVLPSQNAFSFIDHERIRIKELSKKSPKALDLHPLYDFSILNWIDDSSCYCSARERRHFNLFHITNQGDFYRLTRSSNNNYTYPQKVGLNLFYIKKDEDGKTFSIERTIYPEAEIARRTACLECLIKTGQSFEKIECANQELTEEFPEQPIDELLICSETNTALSFLTMVSETKGYFLKHAEYPFSHPTDTTMLFECWKIEQDSYGSWQSSMLLTFVLPLTFLYGQDRLYESILRLVPVYFKEDIYFVSMDTEGNLDVYRHRNANRQVTCCTQVPGEHYFFTPVLCNGTLLCGGMITTDLNSESVDGTSLSPTMTLNEQGEQLVTFLEISK